MKRFLDIGRAYKHSINRKRFGDNGRRELKLRTNESDSETNEEATREEEKGRRNSGNGHSEEASGVPDEAV